MKDNGGLLFDTCKEVHMYRNLQYDAAHKNTPMDNYDEMRAKIAIEVLEDFKGKMFPQNI